MKFGKRPTGWQDKEVTGMKSSVEGLPDYGHGISLLHTLKHTCRFIHSSPHT